MYAIRSYYGLASQISYGIITRRLEQERKKTASELAKNFQVINQIKEAVITTDLSGIITSWNNGASELFGYSPNEAMGENISALLLLKKSDPIHEEYVITSYSIHYTKLYDSLPLYFVRRWFMIPCTINGCSVLLNFFTSLKNQISII